MDCTDKPGASNALEKLRNQVSYLKSEKERNALSEEKLAQIDKFRSDFLNAMNDDLNTPEALAVVWSMLKSNIPSSDKYDLAMSFDEILGLNLNQIKADEKTPEEVKELIKKREELRKEGKYKEADDVRDEIIKMGYTVTDAASKS